MKNNYNNSNENKEKHLKIRRGEGFVKKLYRLGIAILIPIAIGLIGSSFTSIGISGWYETLNKPVFNPPNWIFAPVWTTLYILMGIALYLVWRQGFEKRKVKIAMSIFGFQLILNLAWSFIFFTLHQPAYALIEIIILWTTIVATIYAFRKISTPAAYILIPYLMWVTFAIILNATIVILNF